MLIGPAVARVWAQAPAWTKVPAVTLVASEQDSRLQVAREAVEFWNRVFAEIGTPFRLGPVTHTTDIVPVSYLQRISARVLHGDSVSDLLGLIQRLPGDIILALSEGDFVSFSTHASSSGKVLIGIRNDRVPPLSLPNVTRNVIAHELGHAIGLGHNSDPTMLMCGRPAPCRPDAFQSDTERFFPLTAQEKALLLRMYPVNWRAR
jgi:hypothetical protein